MAKLTKSSVSQFREDFNNMAKMLEIKYGVAVTLGTIRFDESALRATMRAVDTTPPNVTTTPVVRNVTPTSVTPVLTIVDATISRPVGDCAEDCFARVNGINFDSRGFIGSKYVIAGKRNPYFVTGVNFNAPKYCLEVTTPTGARYKMTREGLKNAKLLGWTHVS